MENDPPRGQVDARGQATRRHDDLDGALIERTGHNISLFGRQPGILM